MEDPGKQSAEVRAQDVDSEVKQGEIIGTTGGTGVSDGIHLHFEVRVNGVEQEHAVDPWIYLP